MHSLEALYVIALSLLVIFSVISGGIRLHQDLQSYAEEVMEAELHSHTEGEEKLLFQPELFCRSITVYENIKE